MADPALAAAMAELTAAREAQMVDAGKVTRPTQVGQTPQLDAGGNVVEPPPATIYTGPCTISQPGQLGPGHETVNDQAGVPNLRVLKVPHRAALRPGDLFTVTASTFSPGLVGDTFVVVGEDERSYATCRRYHLRGSSWQSPAAT